MSSCIEIAFPRHILLAFKSIFVQFLLFHFNTQVHVLIFGNYMDVNTFYLYLQSTSFISIISNVKVKKNYLYNLKYFNISSSLTANEVQRSPPDSFCSKNNAKRESITTKTFQNFYHNIKCEVEIDSLIHQSN